MEEYEFVQTNCPVAEPHPPHWITRPPIGAPGGEWCLGVPDPEEDPA